MVLLVKERHRRRLGQIERYGYPQNPRWDERF